MSTSPGFGVRRRAGSDRAGGRALQSGGGARSRRKSCHLFKAPDYPPPHEIAGLIGDMARMAGKHADLLSPAAIADYFGEVYWRVGARLDGKDILGKFRLSGTQTDFAYRTAAAEFQMIESGMLPVIVPPREMSKVLCKSCQWRKSHLADLRATCKPMSCKCRRKRGRS